MTTWRAERVISSNDDSYKLLSAARDYATTNTNDGYTTQTAIDKGCLLLTNKRIKINNDGFIVFTMSNAAAAGGSKLALINMYVKGSDETAHSFPVAFCRCASGDGAQAGGCSCTIPVYAGETYEFYSSDWDDGNHPYLAYYIF